MSPLSSGSSLSAGITSPAQHDRRSSVPVLPLCARDSCSNLLNRPDAFISTRLISASPLCHQRRPLLQSLLTDIFTPSTILSPISKLFFCTSAAFAAAASSSASQPIRRDNDERQPEPQPQLSLRLKTAFHGFSKDNLPTVALNRIGGGDDGRGWISTMRQRLRREQRGVVRSRRTSNSSTSSATEEEEVEGEGLPTFRPTDSRAACFGDDSFFVTKDAAADVMGEAIDITKPRV